MNTPRNNASSGKTPAGVVFDVDGVLVDSYQAHLESWQAIAAAHHREFTQAMFEATFGHTSRDIIRRFWNETDLTDQQIKALDDEKEAQYRDIVAADFPVMEGAVQLIDLLHKDGFLLAAGSSGPAKNVQLAIDRLGRRGEFSAIVTGQDVVRGKPDPEIFHLAATRMGRTPRQCVVIEDATAGVAAARAAGMAVIVLLSKGHKPADFAGQPPDQMINSLREISAQQLRHMIAMRETKQKNDIGSPTPFH